MAEHLNLNAKALTNYKRYLTMIRQQSVASTPTKYPRTMPHYPRVSIKFCTKCKWNLRAAWYLQELLQTFGEKLGEVALIPFESGVFRVEVQLINDLPPVQLWDRAQQGGFPDSKVLKQKVRDALFPDQVLGHVDKKSTNDGMLLTEEAKTEDECKDCVN